MSRELFPALAAALLDFLRRGTRDAVVGHRGDGNKDVAGARAGLDRGHDRVLVDAVGMHQLGRRAAHEVALGLALHHEEAEDVDADLLEQLVDRHVGRAARALLHLLAAAVERHELPDGRMVADLEDGRLAPELQVLRNRADGGEGVDPVPLSHPDVGLDHRVGTDGAPVADRHLGADDGVRADRDVHPELRARVRRAHEGFPDQEAADPPGEQRPHVLAREYPAFGDDDTVARAQQRSTPT